MVTAAIGGMQLKRWTGYFKIIWPTLKVLKQAKRAEGCVHADTFKVGDVFFAVSVWDDAQQMQSFAKSGLHGDLTNMAMEHMALFYNHTAVFDTVPTRQVCVETWSKAMIERDGKGTVGIYTDLEKLGAGLK